MSSLAHLYIISEGEDGPIKIGRSRNAWTRLQALQTGNPRSLKIAAAWALRPDEVVEAESMLHEELENFELVGEWFQLSEKFIFEYMPDFFLANGIDARCVT